MAQCYHVYKSVMTHHLYPMLKNAATSGDLGKTVHGIIIIGEVDQNFTAFLNELKSNYTIETHILDTNPAIFLPFISNLLKNDGCVIFHGLHYSGIWQKLFLWNKKKLSRIGYICWGEMIENKQNLFKQFIKKQFISRVLNRMNFVGVLSLSDLEKFQKIGVKNACHFIYPIDAYSKVGKVFIDKILAPAVSEPVVIQLAHCNDRQLRHIYWLKRLKKVLPANQHFQIICPLNYGSANNEYVEEVCKVGQNLFGDQFVAYTKLLPTDEYTQIISQVNIYVFDNFKDVQNGLFHIFFFLSKGAKVFLRSGDPNVGEVPIGTKLYLLEELDAKYFLLFQENDLRQNIVNMLKAFDYQYLHQKQSMLFQQLLNNAKFSNDTK